jgi:hypothetical protein
MGDQMISGAASHKNAVFAKRASQRGIDGTFYATGLGDDAARDIFPLAIGHHEVWAFA